MNDDIARSIAEALGRLARFDRGRLEAKVAVVTGAGMGADGPIGTGAAIAHLFAAHGASVVLVDKAPAPAERTAASIADHGGLSMLFEGDVTDEETCGAIVDAAVSTWGRLDVLVNNVGISPQATVADVELDAWDAAYRTNLTSALLMTRAAATPLADAGGSIVNISSIAAVRTFGAVSYGATKAALIALTQESAHALGPGGVRANCILPGHIHAAMSGSISTELRDRRRRATALGTEGTAWDVASAALFLASEDARWITGVTLPVDAGTVNLTATAMPRHDDGE